MNRGGLRDPSKGTRRGPEAACGIGYPLVPYRCPAALALVDTGAECMLLYGNPEKFLGPEASIDGYGVLSVGVRAMQLSLGIG